MLDLEQYSIKHQDRSDLKLKNHRYIWEYKQDGFPKKS